VPSVSSAPSDTLSPVDLPAQRGISAAPTGARSAISPACFLCPVEQLLGDDRLVLAFVPLTLILYLPEVEAVLQHHRHGVFTEQPQSPIPAPSRAIILLVQRAGDVGIRVLARCVPLEGQFHALSSVFVWVSQTVSSVLLVVYLVAKGDTAVPKPLLGPGSFPLCGLLTQVVERVYIDGEDVVAMTLRSNCHLSIGP
jgi:hypothetical protein